MDELNQPPENRPTTPEKRIEMNQYNPPITKRAPRKFSVFLSGFAGVMIGALLVWFLMPEATTPQGTNGINNAGHGIVQDDRVPIEVTTDITKIVDAVADSVVGITNLQTERNIWSSGDMLKESGTGSGVIYKIDGDKAYIVTNHHVVENAESLDITFDDGTKTEGTLIGSDIWSDLAVVEISSKDVKTTAIFGDSDKLKRGETVLAIGNPLGLGFSGSVTLGVVSGKDRSIPIDLDRNGTIDWYADVLQTDAAINPGNSGGALMNLGGQLIGINSMKISEATVEGMGLAIPINIAIPIIDSLETIGAVNRPTMGVTLLDLHSVSVRQQRDFLELPANVTEGVVVNEVIENSPAELSGVQQYDVIVEMDGEEIEDLVSLRKHLYNEKAIGDTLKMKVYRQGKLMDIEMVLKNGSSF